MFSSEIPRSDTPISPPPGWADYLHLSEFPLLEHVVEDLDRVLLGKELKFVEHPCLFTVV